MLMGKQNYLVLYKFPIIMQEDGYRLLLKKNKKEQSTKNNK